MLNDFGVSYMSKLEFVQFFNKKYFDNEMN